MQEYNRQFPVELSNTWISNKTAKKNRLIIKKGQENLILKIEDVLFFYTDNSIVYLLDKHGYKYIYESNLTALESCLDIEMFFRANRKYLVNINYIKSYKAFEKVKLMVDLTVPGIEHRVIISQETAPLFKKWILGN
jgi:DNA-binding LytR/AlgR family response regulator